MSVIVPFHRDLGQLAKSLSGIRAAIARSGAALRAEVIVVADGARQDPGDVAAAAGARLLRIAGPRGPAVARNRGALAARGDLLVFVDTDVVVHDDVLRRFVELMSESPGVGAAFGA